MPVAAVTATEALKSSAYSCLKCCMILFSRKDFPASTALHRSYAYYWHDWQMWVKVATNASMLVDIVARTRGRHVQVGHLFLHFQ